MNPRQVAPVVVNGWNLFAHPLFLDAVEDLARTVERLKRRDPDGYRKKNATFAWVNDEGTKRAYESDMDAYRVFERMLTSGHPPDDWDQLVKEATSANPRLRRLSDDSM